MTKHVKITPKLRPDQIPCDPVYFKNFIQGKKLEIIREYKSMIRVRDIYGEEWSLFNGQFVKCTGL